MQRSKKRSLRLTTEKKHLPNGRVVLVEIIRHPGAALIIPFLSQDTILLLRQFRPVIGKYLYELPAGTIDGKERPIDCARREIIEETGFAAGRMTRIGEIFPVPGYSTEIITIFRAEKLKETRCAKEIDEIIDVFPCKKSEIRKLFRKGHLRDAKTICALAFCGYAS